jgi:hypothetical protein
MSLPAHYIALGRDIVESAAPQSFDDARRLGPEPARRRAVRTLDDTLVQVEAQARRTLACVQGCAFCCHRPVAAGAAEVFGLVDYLRETLEPDAFEAFRTRCLETAALVEALPAGQRSLRSIACPVLVSGACSGYAARPFRCRAYNSLDVEPCQRYFDAPRDNDPGPPADLDRYVVAQAVMFGLYAGLDRAGLDPRQYELATALADALTDAESARRYRRGEQAFLRAIVFA